MIKQWKNKHPFVVLLVILQILSILVSRDLVLNNNIDQQNRELPFLGNENRSVLSKSFQEVNNEIVQNDGTILDSEREQDSENSNPRATNLQAQDPKVLDSGSDSFEVTEQYTGTGSYFGSNRLNTSNIVKCSTRSNNFSAPPAPGYDKDAGTFTITNISSTPDWLTIENYTEPFLERDSDKNGDRWYEVAMAFTIPVEYANVTEIRISLRVVSKANMTAYILNSTETGTPSTITSDVLSDKVVNTEKEIVTIRFSSPATLRNGRVYYVVLNDTEAPYTSPRSYWKWHLTNDYLGNQDQGNFYQRSNTHSGEWNLEPYDLILSVHILPVTNETGHSTVTYDSNPKLALFKYGSTLLNDSSDLKNIQMDVIDTHVFTSSISITFDLVWSRNFTIHSFPVSSHFYVANGTSVSWNLTFDAHGISGISYSVKNHLLNLSHLDRLPSDWNLTTTYNGTIEYGDSSPEVLYQNGDPFLIVNASNGLNSDAWRVEFSSPNYLVAETLETENVIGGTPADYRGQTINIISQFMEGTTNGLYNISATFPNGTHTVIPGAAQLPVSSDTEIKSIALVANWFLPNGSYNITVVFWNGTEAGHLVQPLLVLSPTILDVDELTSPLFNGTVLNITVSFNENPNGTSSKGIVFANVVTSPSWGGNVTMTAAVGMPGVYYANLSTTMAEVGPDVVIITAEKLYYQNHTISRSVDFRPKILVELIFTVMAKTLVRGEDFVLEARLCQPLGGILHGLVDNPLQNELLSFSVTVLFENNTELTFIENSRTNDEGLARFFLSREVTRNFRTFIGISVTYGGSTAYQGTTITVAAENLPSIHSQTAEKDLLIDQLFGFFVDYILLIFLVLLGVLILSIFSMNKLRSHQMASEEDRAYERYLEELRTILMVVIRQLDGVPLFSQSMFGSDESLDHAVAGLSTALSAFLQDVATRSVGEGSSIGKDRPEFVRMEQKGLHLLQRNGAYTAAIVISEAALGVFIEDNLRNFQMAVEKRFHTEFERFFSSGQIPPDVLAVLASKHLYIGLMGAFRLNETKLESAEKLLTGKASRIVAELWNYKKEIPDHRMFLDSYISYLENQGIPVAESFRFLLKGYQDGLFEPLSYAELLQVEEQM